MLGWEFPPHISGGLGTACFGLTQGLDHHGVEVLFVVPKARGDEDERFVDALVPPGTTAVHQFNDPAYPIEGRKPRTSARGERA